MYILGISAFYHDSAAALVRDGIIVVREIRGRFCGDVFGDAPTSMQLAHATAAQVSPSGRIRATSVAGMRNPH